MQTQRESKEPKVIFSSDGLNTDDFLQMVEVQPISDKYPILVRESVGDQKYAFTVTSRLYDPETGDLESGHQRFYFTNGEWSAPEELIRPQNALSIEQIKASGQDPGKSFYEAMIKHYPPAYCR